MTDNKNQPDIAAKLRRQAEEKLRQEDSLVPESFLGLSPEEISQKLHDLRVHQIELEMQNEELRRTQEELGDSRARYFDLYDLAPVGYLTISETGLILETNLTAATLLCKARNELAKQPVSNFILKEDQDIYYRHRKQLFETGEPQTCELRMVRPEEPPFWARLDATAAQDKDGSLTCRVVMVDITENKMIAAQLHQARKMESLGTLTGGIAHDFNNLLYMIVGNTELALEDIPKWNPAYTSLEEIKSASLRAAGIVKQLLNFSRKTDEKLIPIDAVTVIKDSLKLLRSTIPTTVEINEHIPDDEIVILADSTQINQVMMNLCINASQAMEETGGTLKINIEKTIFEAKDVKAFSDLVPGNYLKITVNDTGPGISPEIINQIFDPYFTTKEIGKGSGMGLSVVQGIIKNHGGAIWVASILGKGTKFIILFPLTSEESMVEAQTTKDIPRGKETILFVDDEISITKMVKRMFERLGYKIETATTPQDALELFRSNPDHFDLVITDMTMPQMTGVKLSEKLMDIRKDIPIIVCTGHSNLVNEEKAKELGLAAYIMKPIYMQEAAQIIRKVLDK